MKIFAFCLVLLCVTTSSVFAQANCESLSGAERADCLRKRRIANARAAAQQTPKPDSTRTVPQVQDSVMTAKPDSIQAKLVVENLRFDDGTSTPPPPPSSQEEPTPPAPEFYENPEQMPEIVGGIAGIQSSVRYPEISRRAGVQGTVIVSVVVNPNGFPTQMQILKSISADCDTEALRVIRDARFVPGKQGNQNVAVRISIPVRFRLGLDN